MSVIKLRLLVISVLPFSAIAANAQTVVSKIEYTTAALFWDLASVDSRLGPDFEALNGTIVVDTRPTLYMPPSTPWAAGYTRGLIPYQIGGPPAPTAITGATAGRWLMCRMWPPILGWTAYRPLPTTTRFSQSHPSRTMPAGRRTLSRIRSSPTMSSFSEAPRCSRLR